MKKILVIDDDRDIAEAVEMALSSQYLVAVETDNDNIVERVTSFLPDLIILDNWVGQKAAQEILTELRRHHDYNSTPIVLFSGHPDVSEVALQIKADAWLSKPFALADLYTCVNNLLN